MLSSRNSFRTSPHHLTAALCAAGVLACAMAPAHAVGVPGVDVYMGVGIGQSDADLSASDLGVTSFDKSDLGWKVFLGGRFASVLGAELSYLDFGKPSGGGADVKYKALAGFGMFYLPLPLPILDIYAKAGVARLDSNLHVNTSSFSTKDTKLAYGAGVQLKFGSFAIRGEYEKFKVADVKPSMLSVSFSKSFL
jgi:hypothetical protein